MNRNKPWIAIVFGYNTRELKDEEIVKNFLFEVFHATVSQAGIPLESHYSFYIHTDSWDNVMKGMTNYEAKSDKLPVVLFIDDLEQGSGLQAEFQHSFKSSAYIFNMTGSEFKAFRDSKNYTEFNSWCSEFAKIVQKTDIELAERKKRQHARKHQEELERRRHLEMERQRDMERERQRKDERSDEQKWHSPEYPDYRQSYDHRNYDPYREHDRGGYRHHNTPSPYEDPMNYSAYKDYHDKYDEYEGREERQPYEGMRRREDGEREQQRQQQAYGERFARQTNISYDNRDRSRYEEGYDRERQYADSRRDDYDGRGEGERSRRNDNSHLSPSNEDQVRKEPSSNEQAHPDIQLIQSALSLCQDFARKLPEENDMAAFIYGEVFSSILKTGLGSMSHNVDLLSIVCLAIKTNCSKAIEQAACIIDECIRNNFIVNLMFEYCEPALQSEYYWTEELYHLFKNLLLFFDYASLYFPDIQQDALYGLWEECIYILNNMSDDFWNLVESKAYNSLIQASTDVSIRFRHLRHQDNIDKHEEFFKMHTDDGYRQERERSPSPFQSNYGKQRYDVKPLWMECEAVQPPNSFRELSAFPIKSDVYKPEKPYIRRVKEDGVYEDPEHYLDIQFRLLREDMISPLREGILLYKKFGRIRNERGGREKDPYEDMELADLAMFQVLEVEGIQVRPNIGTQFRYAYLDENSVQSALMGKYLRFGQMVCLSDDDFNEDMHIATVVERDDNRLLTNKILGLEFIEDGTLKKKHKYAMIEPSSYLEAYQHVLKVIKEKSIFSPMPFERYLIYGKKDVRRPLYTRLALTSDEEKEDDFIYKFYEKMRTEAEAKLNKKRKEKKEMKKKKNGGNRFSPTDSNSYSDSDEELAHQLNVPLRPYTIGGFTEERKNSIELKGKMYKLDKLVDEYTDGGLDESQRKALSIALTHELAIIQGPPGTGKTFISVEIVDAILRNRSRWGITTPILIVCYTNQALDQFLERIYQKIALMELPDDIPTIVRIGTKCESSFIINAKMLKRDVCEMFRDLRDVKKGRGKEFGTAFKNRKAAQEELCLTSFAMKAIGSEILSFEQLCQVISESHLKEFSAFKKIHKDSKGIPLNDDETLACWLLNKEFAEGKRTDLPPTEEELENEDEEEKHMSEEMAVQLYGGNEIKPDKTYLVEKVWDMAKDVDSRCKNAVIFGRRSKSDSNSRQIKKEHPIDTILMSGIEMAKEKILKISAMNGKEVEEVKKVFSLTKLNRWRLYAFWRQKLQSQLRNKMPDLIANYSKCCELTRKLQVEQDVNILRKSLIIGATTTGAAKNRKMLEKIGCRVLVVEEAAEVLEAHILSALLPTVEHAILVGDHQQLRPNPAVYELALYYGLEISLFERLVKADFPFVQLETQHRMHPIITASIVRPYFYNNLQDFKAVSQYPMVKGLPKRLFFWSHCENETPLDSTSRKNDTEVAMVVSLVDYLLKQGYDTKQITVIATYAAQTNVLRRVIGDEFGTDAALNKSLVAVETVDSFQGKENDIVIVSMVRSNSNGVGFLNVANRICVALTRARHGMYIVGNLYFIANCSPHLWGKIARTLINVELASSRLPISCQQHGNIQYVESAQDMRWKSQHGGCSQDCSYILSCGHQCHRKCHPEDDHLYARCVSCDKEAKEKELTSNMSRLALEAQSNEFDPKLDEAFT